LRKAADEPSIELKGDLLYLAEQFELRAAEVEQLNLACDPAETLKFPID
jgi:hypothetical protein